jgi:ferredoxin-NADP reductase
MRFVDNLLNKITMYKLVLYGLLILAALSIVFGFLGILSFSGLSLLISLVIIVLFCYLSNLVLAKLYSVEANTESYFITAVILFFLLAPISSVNEFYITALIAIAAMASKYVLAINRKHVFNPAAISVFIFGLFGVSTVFWWVGSSVLLIPTAILGFLILRKVKRFQLFFSFVITSLITMVLVALSQGNNLLEPITQIFLSGPILFFGTVMLTEPLTAPPDKYLRIGYGALVGILFGLQFHFGIVYSTPELALIIGNIFSFIVSPRLRLKLSLLEKKNLSSDVYEFVWKLEEKINYKAGQYLEWTLGHKKADIRGNRRYFTISSSPTEDTLRLGVKFYEPGSSFKTKLKSLSAGDTIIASQLAGDFTLPDDKNKKLVFIAGGIGVTPFRSMIKYLLDKGEKRDIVFIFSNKTANDIVYKDIFDSAEKNLGIKVLYVVNELSGVGDLNMRVGFLDTYMVMKEVPDFKDRMFYISGPHGMINAFEDTLKKVGISRSDIKIDFFPGFV